MHINTWSCLWLFSDMLRRLAFSFRILQGQRWTLHPSVLLGAHATCQALGETLGWGRDPVSAMTGQCCGVGVHEVLQNPLAESGRGDGRPG